MNIWDWELELEHVIYLFIAAFTWLGLSLWSNFALNMLYAPSLPASIQTFTIICFWIGGGGILFGVILLVITASE